MSKNGTLAIVRVLSEARHPLFVSVIAARVGITPDAAGKALSRLRSKGMASWTKDKDSHTSSYHKWSMTDVQHLAYLAHRDDSTVMGKGAEQKLDFLRLVRRNPMYADNPALNLIIDDYKFISPAVEAAHG